MPLTRVRRLKSPVNDQPIDDLKILQVIDRIEKLNSGIAKFWLNSIGWAPENAAALLAKSRLDWQVSLSSALKIWIREPADDLTSGELILAWVNLGSLVEGSIKTMLSVWLKDYSNDLENLKKANAYNKIKQKIIEPDSLGLEKLRRYCKLQNLLSSSEDALVVLVQQRRNAVHAFQNRAIGDGKEFQQAVRGYLALLRAVNSKLPYPDIMYAPDEL
ncbi:MAG: hypothetical protein KF835_06115 [Xanthobacteraceae bacterium]|jgi:hypothetical protein|nr:hypothetical protein [Xanthobacteraceae bacterium]MBX3519579.1 hypothetical protein [Xanthobacteraceae bacterium]MBX3549249.1 hypothetical protein [Xanthobacteraceae bacterium]